MNPLIPASAVSMLLLLGGFSGCTSAHKVSASTGAAAGDLASLQGGLDALVDRFNDDAHKPRVVVLLSPT